jgi:hypothetical protein
MGGSVKKIGGYAKQVPGVTSLAAGGNGLGILGGKQQAAVGDSYTPLDPSQVKAIGKYNTMMDTDTDALARSSINEQEKQIRSNTEDMERKAGQMVNQRGLGSTSVGLNAILNTSRNTADKISDTRAKLPGLQYDMKMSNLNNSTNGINSILNTRLFKQGTPAGAKQGGLLPILGMGLGAAYGGPAGAGMGYGAGNALNQMA